DQFCRPRDRRKIAPSALRVQASSGRSVLPTSRRSVRPTLDNCAPTTQMQIKCRHCLIIMSVPDQAAQLGGLFTCPRCQVVTTLAPVAAVAGAQSPSPVPVAQPKAPPDKSTKPLIVVLTFVIG